MPRQSGAERNERCVCGHIRWIHAPGEKCMACVCQKFEAEKEEDNELDRESS